MYFHIHEPPQCSFARRSTRQYCGNATADSVAYSRSVLHTKCTYSFVRYGSGTMIRPHVLCRRGPQFTERSPGEDDIVAQPRVDNTRDDPGPCPLLVSQRRVDPLFCDIASTFRISTMPLFFTYATGFWCILSGANLLPCLVLTLQVLHSTASISE